MLKFVDDKDLSILKEYGFKFNGVNYEYQLKEFKGYDSCEACILIYAGSREVCISVTYNKGYNYNHVDEGDTLIDSVYNCEIIYTLIKDNLIERMTKSEI